ncbi:hypothetical protein AA106_15850 [Photorhabdus laumondii subsp. laumondii]|uniref:hypothetical protein n=1 Tax=Photorhabdus laumondii TaxID=2218628 RepID=UPI0007335B60|nr:hypothetical protein [Photorhabdus laumondii]KTL59737.1 hypothetical protein AA106_15850 [Photorhabdus laumondii subsp. laumondii]
MHSSIPDILDDSNIPDLDILWSVMSDAIASLDFSCISDTVLCQLIESSKENTMGMCHGVTFLGDSMLSFASNNIHEFTPESLCQLGHSLEALSSLLPMLFTLHEKANGECHRRALKNEIK